MNITQSDNKSDKKAYPMHPIVVIGRQFGCGGREIGRLIANHLQAAYYDKTLLSEAAKRLGFSEEIFNSTDEKRPSWLRSLLSYSYGAESAVNEGIDIDNEGLYHLQSRVIKALADAGPCVFVGRTADYILREYPNMLSIFLHAPADARARNIIARKDASTTQSAISMARKMDNARQSFYSYYTNRKWGSADNYHLSIDTSRFSTDQIIALINDYFQNLE